VLLPLSFAKVVMLIFTANSGLSSRYDATFASEGER
jgi:hypothetical protein